MNARMTARAEGDLEEAFDYYEGLQKGLGLELLDEYRRTLALIVEYPLSWQIFEGYYRRTRLHRFPYGIVYQIENNEIVIAAVMHLSRKPDSWKR